MSRSKKIVAVAAVAVAATFGVAGVASAQDGGHHHGRHDHGLVAGLLHTVGHLLRDL